MERPGATTLKGKPLTLIGPELKAGETAPDFALVDTGLKPVTLQETTGAGPHYQRGSLAGHAGVRCADQAIQRRGRPRCPASRSSR